ncbi:MAG TPA: DUF1365 domain-containing protein [Candidatus Deferrimicrobiaceae bacterium]|nr:DUF1365 domain-containing protein [Candidatus Deferrimicrobiaceae bacterium]
MTVRSAVYTGEVRHRRFAPARNEFRYRLFLLYLDLAELPGLFDRYLLWSARGPNLAWFRREDSLGDPSVPLDRAVRDLVSERLGFRPEGPVRLLTHLRYFGYLQNPVSFYYCFDREDARVEAIVAEITNTPWGERHAYVFGDRGNEAAHPSWRRYRFRKAFHVSPFLDMGIDYDWRFREPGEALSVFMIALEKGERIFDAGLSLRKKPLTSRTLAAALASHSFMSGKVVAGIYWQALRLWLKRVPFFAHPSKRTPAR